MKRLISATLALTLMGTVAASAQSYRGGYGSRDGYSQHSYSQSYNSYNRGGYDRYSRNDYRGSYRSHDNSGALIGLGIGLMALAAIAGSQHHNDYDRGYDYRGGGYGYGGGYYGR
jgi:hypothetical protein